MGKHLAGLQVGIRDAIAEAIRKKPRRHPVCHDPAALYAELSGD